MATTCLQWCVNVNYTADFIVKQLGILIGVRRRTVVQLAKLDRIQCEALRISTGAMRGTSLTVLQAHCGEMPLQLRRLKSPIEYSVKVRCSDGHVSSSVFNEHWTRHYGTYNDRNLQIAIKVVDFDDTVEMSNVEAPKTG